MNIFYLHSDPVKAATVQYNKHVVKMILESAQPSTIWCRQNDKQYMWLFNHMLALGAEYTKRYGKKHVSIDKCFGPLSFLPPNIPTDQEFTEPPQCMPDKYKVPGCSITAYWNYYEGEKYTVANKDEMLITRPKEYETKIISTLN